MHSVLLDAEPAARELDVSFMSQNVGLGNEPLTSNSSEAASLQLLGAAARLETN